MSNSWFVSKMEILDTGVAESVVPVLVGYGLQWNTEFKSECKSTTKNFLTARHSGWRHQCIDLHLT